MTTENERLRARLTAKIVERERDLEDHRLENNDYVGVFALRRDKYELHMKDLKESVDDTEACNKVLKDKVEMLKGKLEELMKDIADKEDELKSSEFENAELQSQLSSLSSRETEHSPPSPPQVLALLARVNALKLFIES